MEKKSKFVLQNQSIKRIYKFSRKLNEPDQKPSSFSFHQVSEQLQAIPFQNLFCIPKANLLEALASQTCFWEDLRFLQTPTCKVKYSTSAPTISWEQRPLFRNCYTCKLMIMCFLSSKGTLEWNEDLFKMHKKKEKIHKQNEAHLIN